MKTRFDSFDIVCCVTELQRLIGMRVNNVYDVDSKTYLLRLQRGEERAVLLLESGARFHSTGFEWPKNAAPSGFSMKMRKHLRNKRLERLAQLGADRVVDARFGSGEAAHHLVLELYDRGNLVLTDHERTILYVLRPHTEGDRFRFAVGERYPAGRAKEGGPATDGELRAMLADAAATGDQLRRVLVPRLEYGPALIEHVLVRHRLRGAARVGRDFDVDGEDVARLSAALAEAEAIVEEARRTVSKGYIVQRLEERASAADITRTEQFRSNQQFHPYPFAQHASSPRRTFDTFNQAADEFYSALEGQRLEVRAAQRERDALRKLENVRRDHSRRLEDLQCSQEADARRAELVARNQPLVDGAIASVRAALANQMAWGDVAALVRDASAAGDAVAGRIAALKLETNHVTLLLSDPYDEGRAAPAPVDVDLALSAFANARSYYDARRSAARKHERTVLSEAVALRSAEKRTRTELREARATAGIAKARKVYWFERFFWFVSSEGYLVIAGRDQQQNEVVVKRYMGAADVYVHADVHGAASVVVKNPSGRAVPPKTLNEAGVMAICYSVAWEAKVVTSAYWVRADQVSKTAPAGEYLVAGAFMIRGRKNFLPPAQLVLGLAFLFRLEEGSVARHAGERRVATGPEDPEAAAEGAAEEEVEVAVSDGSDDEEDAAQEEAAARLADVPEEEEEEEGAAPPIQIKLFSQLAADKNGAPTAITSSGRFSRQNSTDGKRMKEASKKEDGVEEEEKKQRRPKRGQRSKLKKIREKYGDQDEEERNLRMRILQSAGPPRAPKGSKRPKGPAAAKPPQQRKPAARPPRAPSDPDPADDEPAAVHAQDVDVIEALTGCPTADDELLFAVPVVAPYTTLVNYKFKVKLTPGTSRRGKAARTAVSMFLQDRAAGARERDLLRAVKDEQLARNIPGKVKLSAPRLQAVRR